MAALKSALFVCLGNTCRSPIAEAVFLHQIKKDGCYNNWEVDSAGLADWNVGILPAGRARSTLDKHNVSYNHLGRQIKVEDYNKYDYIFGMDHRNMDDLRALAPIGCKAKILLLGDFDPQGETVIRDPYFDSGIEGFEKCFEQSMRCCRAFLDTLQP